MIGIRVLRRFASIPGGAGTSILKRELLADVWQLSIKYTAYCLSGSHAMRAEFQRTISDFITHLVLYKVNELSKRVPDDFFNYGYAKFKNVGAMIPGILFGISGVYNLAMPVCSLIVRSPDIPELTLNFWSLLSITASSVAEFYVTYKNLGDISSEPAANNVIKRIIERTALLYKIWKQHYLVDPIQHAIINENIISIAGVIIPITTSFICYYTGWIWLDIMGRMLNGLLQLHISNSMFSENMTVILGKSLSKTQLEIVKKILEDRDTIQKVEGLKTEQLTSKSMKLYMDVIYNAKEITENIIEVLEDDISQISTDSEVQKKIRKLIGKSNDLVITHQTEIIKDMEEDVKKKYPLISQIDIELSSKNINPAYEGVVTESDDDEDGQKKDKV
ncbi:SLC30A9_1 [Blepharisma stoltei]|uniref:Cation efflux protein transmembrane domain-containing protein n=1 Tax=Blepharisma stoltei TaxID=1481888 RepID=A0AAU9IRD5_9CILI|nr:unnamed protein product [Blepharisma stoltei]